MGVIHPNRKAGEYAILLSLLLFMTIDAFIASLPSAPARGEKWVFRILFVYIVLVFLFVPAECHNIHALFSVLLV